MEPENQLDLFAPKQPEGEQPEPDEPEAKPEPDYSKKPGAIWNGRIWATDDDLAF
jgi:hypothetical protein